MKAILVIDIDDSLIEGDERFAIDGYLVQESDCVGCYEAVGLIRNAVLKPLPQKESEKHREEIEDWTGLAYSQGWNDCIDAITGETE